MTPPRTLIDSVKPQEAALPAFFPRVAAALGAAYTLGGRVADAVPLLTQVIEQATAMERVDLQVLCILPLGAAHVLTDRLEEAHALAERALTLAREHQERGNQAYALRLLGEIAAHRAVPGHGHDLLAASDRGGAGAGGGTMMDYDAIVA